LNSRQEGVVQAYADQDDQDLLVSLFRCRHDGGRVAAGMPPGRCDKRLRIPQDRFDWRLAHGAKHGVAAGSVIAPATSPRQRASVATAQAGASGQGRPERALERISSTTALHCIRLGAATHGGRTAPFLFYAILFCRDPRRLGPRMM